jgi:hypothetical protein
MYFTKVEAVRLQVLPPQPGRQAEAVPHVPLAAADERGIHRQAQGPIPGRRRPIHQRPRNAPVLVAVKLKPPLTLRHGRGDFFEAVRRRGADDLQHSTR